MISVAVSAGSRVIPGCQAVGISTQTYRSWNKDPGQDDQRHGPLSEPANKLSDAERNAVVTVCTSKKYRDISPDKIVPALADEGCYLASETTFYRILRKERLLTHRSDAAPKTRKRYAAPDLACFRESSVRRPHRARRAIRVRSTTVATTRQARG